VATRLASQPLIVGPKHQGRPIDPASLLMLAALLLVPASFVPLATAHGGPLIVIAPGLAWLERRLPFWPAG
jgi:hypothetical protein